MYLGTLGLGHLDVLAQRPADRVLAAQQEAPALDARDYKGLHAFPSTITRDDPPITSDYTPFLLLLQGMTLQLQGITRLSFYHYKG